MSYKEVCNEIYNYPPINYGAMLIMLWHIFSRFPDPFSTNLFNFVLEVLMRKTKIQTACLMHHHKEQCIAYADDIVLLTR